MEDYYKGIITSFIITSLCFMIIVWDQSSTIKKLLRESVERELELGRTLDLAKTYQAALVVNIERASESEKIMVKALKSLGLNDHVKFFDNKITLAIGEDVKNEARKPPP